MTDEYAQWTPTRRTDVEVTDMPDGLVVFDSRSHTAHHLNAPAALVWELLDGRTAEQVDADVASVLEIDLVDAHAHVTTTLDALRKQGLIA